MQVKKRALITGAEGFIGSHLVRLLEAKGWNVVGTCLSESSDGFSTASGVCYVQCDLRNGQRVSHVLNDYEPTHIFHLGAQSLPTISWSDPVRTLESNVMGSLYVFEAVRHMRRRPTVVSACSSAEYGIVPESAIPVREDQPFHPLHPYGISKVCLDLLAKEYFVDYGIRAVNLRLFNTTGPGKTDDAPSDFVQQLVRIRKGKQSPVIEVGNLKPRRAFLDVRDTVRSFYLAALKGRPGEAYNVCATSTHEVGKMLRTAMRLAGVKAEIRQTARLMRPSDERIIFGSTRKILRDTGWKPMFSLEQTLKSMLDYWEERL
jgi:GDP-4-dehydro-6-deoxy-D-mannose reductase